LCNRNKDQYTSILGFLTGTASWWISILTTTVTFPNFHQELPASIWYRLAFCLLPNQTCWLNTMPCTNDVLLLHTNRTSSICRIWKGGWKHVFQLYIVMMKLWILYFLPIYLFLWWISSWSLGHVSFTVKGPSLVRLRRLEQIVGKDGWNEWKSLRLVSIEYT
jgi:hypothetical protein